MKVFTKEWIDALAEMLRNDETYQDAAEGFDSLFQFIVEPDPGRGVTERRALGIKLPQCDETWEGVRQGVDYTMSGPYGIYYEVLQGRMGTTKAITMRKLRVKGNLARLLKYKRAIDRYVELLGEVDAEFDGDYGR